MFADYEDYIKCQEKVSALYKVSMSARGKQEEHKSHTVLYITIIYNVLYLYSIYYTIVYGVYCVALQSTMHCKTSVNTFIVQVEFFKWTRGLPENLSCTMNGHTQPD